MAEKTRRFVDLSHTVEDGTLTYPGLPAPRIGDFLGYEDSRANYAPGTEFQIGQMELVANTGTYLDSPAHRFRGRPDLAQLSLVSLADLAGVVIRPDLQGSRLVSSEVFAGQDLEGKAVLVETGWSQHWGSEQYFHSHPYLDEAAARLLQAARPALVGIDSLNIDDTRDGRRPVHTALLDAGILIVEHLTGLARLPASGFRFFAVPVKVKGMGSFPVRAFAIVEPS